MTARNFPWRETDGVIEVFDVEAYIRSARRYDPADGRWVDPDVYTCGTCDRSWDDGVPTAWTPTPSGRCPFEYEHVYADA